MKVMMAAVVIGLAVLVMACGSQAGAAAVVLGDKVNLRETAEAAGKVLAELAEGDEVFLLETVGEAVKIGRLTDRWVKVLTAHGKEGFVFGAFLFPLQELYQGRWTMVSPSGDSVYRYSFGEDGSWLDDVVYPYDSPGYGAARFSGMFQRRGRKITGTLERVEPAAAGSIGQTWSFWLHRAEGRPVLADRLQAVGEMPGEEDMYLIKEQR